MYVRESHHIDNATNYIDSDNLDLHRGHTSWARSLWAEDLRHHAMTLWNTAPPEPRTRLTNNPTLLFSWWCTIFSAVIIGMRLAGRKVRSSVCSLLAMDFPECSTDY